MLLLASIDDLKPENSYLIKGLKSFEEKTTLIGFAEQLIGFFKAFHKAKGLTPLEHNIIADLESKLGLDVNQNKNEDPKDLLRTIRHMLYGHQTISGDRSDKEITLDHQARIQILLAKRLAIHRVPREIRESTLQRPLPELEKLLILPIENLKSELLQSPPIKPSIVELDRKPNSLLEGRARSVLRVPLTRNAGDIFLELNEIKAKQHLKAPSIKLEAVELLIEYLFELQPDSKEVQKIRSLLEKASKES
ncbi:MAG: hypothetical protein ACSHYB_05325 [Roseibacillus sp.]